MMRDLISLVEEAGEQPAFLYHGTTSKALERILAQGMSAPSHWTSKPEIAQWFAKHKAKERGGRQMVIKLPWSAFDPSTFAPDLNIMDFPIPHHDADHGARLDGLANPRQPTWQESLELFDAILVRAPLHISAEQVSPLR